MELNGAVVDAFQAAPTTDPMLMPTLSWEIPRRATDSWSEMYRRVERFASGQPNVKDFSLVQGSLEQVFIRLSKVEVAPVPGPMSSRHGPPPGYPHPPGPPMNGWQGPPGHPYQPGTQAYGHPAYGNPPAANGATPYPIGAAAANAPSPYAVANAAYEAHHADSNPWDTKM